MEGAQDAFRNLLGRPALLAGTSAGLGALAAGSVVYLVVRRRYEDRIAAEVHEAKAHYASRTAAAEARAAKAEYARDTHVCGTGPVSATTGPGGDENNGPATMGDGGEPGDLKPESGAAGSPQEDALGEDWPGNPGEPAAADDVALEPREVAGRNRSQPYLISYEEFGDEETCIPTHLKYYGADKVLADEKDEPIPDIARTVGKIVFGGISGDPQICYVRNEKLGLDFEITMDGRAFTEVVLNYGRPG